MSTPASNPLRFPARRLGRRTAFVRMVGSALASQAVLSATSFAVGLLLIRHSSDLQYGYYILVSGAILLATSLQNAYIAPPMVNRMTRLELSACGDLTGGLYREQRRVVASLAALALISALTLWLGGRLDLPTLLLLVAAILAMVAALRREYFRMVLIAYRRLHPVLWGDLGYAGLLIAGVLLASFSPMPALAAILALAIAALLASRQLARSLHQVEPWNPQGAPGILRAIAPLGAWSTAGAAIHWSFSQGYTWLVAGTLDISAVAAIAATRLLVMPVNLLSTGIGSLLLPLASRWLHERGASLVLRRLIGFSLVIAVVSLIYFTALWLLRDWLFAVLLKKNFPQRDLLLLLWSASFALMAVNQQLVYLPIVRERFRSLTSLTLVCALLALAVSFWGIGRFGGAGAPLGILVGELLNTIGIILLCLREIRVGTRPLTLCDDVQTGGGTASEDLPIKT